MANSSPYLYKGWVKRRVRKGDRKEHITIVQKPKEETSRPKIFLTSLPQISHMPQKEQKVQAFKGIY